MDQSRKIDLEMFSFCACQAGETVIDKKKKCCKKYKKKGKFCGSCPSK